MIFVSLGKGWLFDWWNYANDLLRDFKSKLVPVWVLKHLSILLERIDDFSATRHRDDLLFRNRHFLTFTFCTFILLNIDIRLLLLRQNDCELQEIIGGLQNWLSCFTLIIINQLVVFYVLALFGSGFDGRVIVELLYIYLVLVIKQTWLFHRILKIVGRPISSHTL